MRIPRGAAVLGLMFLSITAANAQRCQSEVPRYSVVFFQKEPFLRLGIAGAGRSVAVLERLVCYRLGAQPGSVTIVVNHAIPPNPFASEKRKELTASYVALQVVSIVNQNSKSVEILHRRSRGGSKHAGAWYLPNRKTGVVDSSEDLTGYKPKHPLKFSLDDFFPNRLSDLAAPSYPDRKSYPVDGWNALLFLKKRDGDTYSDDTSLINNDWNLSADEISNHVKGKTIRVYNYLKLLTPQEYGEDGFDGRIVRFNVPTGFASCLYVRLVAPATDKVPLISNLFPALHYRFVAIQLNRNFDCPSPEEITVVASRFQ